MGAEETFFRKIGNFFHFFHKVENSENLFIRAYKCAKFQQKIFSEKKWNPSSEILGKNFQFSNLKSDLFGKFSTFHSVYYSWRSITDHGELTKVQHHDHGIMK